MNEGLRALEPDLDAIEALADERESLWRRVSAAAFLTDDERSGRRWGMGVWRTGRGGDDCVRMVFSLVIPGLVPGIHVFAPVGDLDGRDEPGHDGVDVISDGASRCGIAFRMEHLQPGAAQPSPTRRAAPEA
jgi:hypothetical protein